jgi:hypothetical protein
MTQEKNVAFQLDMSFAWGRAVSLRFTGIKSCTTRSYLDLSFGTRVPWTEDTFMYYDFLRPGVSHSHLDVSPCQQYSKRAYFSVRESKPDSQNHIQTITT